MKRFPQIKPSPVIQGASPFGKKYQFRTMQSERLFSRLFKTADQVMLNIMISLNRLKLALVKQIQYDGIQIGKPSIVQKKTLGLDS